MSAIAEFAPLLHRTASVPNTRILSPIHYPSNGDALLDVRAVVFDVYGTLVNYWRADFSDEIRKEAALTESFRITAERFGFVPFLEVINPGADPAITLKDFYHGLIGIQHDKARAKGREFPEMRIEDVWAIILLMLERRGFVLPAELEGFPLEDRRDFSKCIAYHYNFHSLGRGMYPGVTAALETLGRNGMKTGIVSNAQFYTPLDLTLFVRDQSNDRIDDHLDLIDRNLVVYSYEEGVSKPNPQLFRRLYDALYEYEILPSQTLFVGNDLVSDIRPAQDAGMKTAFFTGDDKSAFVHDMAGEIIPDIVFSKWEDLPGMIAVNER